MGKSKKAERKHLSQTGTILFNGTLTLQLKGKTYQVRTEYHGLDLQRASQNHEVIVLIKQHLPYDEIDTGYIVRAKEYDKQHCFGLKSTKDSKMWPVYNYSDVVAWGYADGGLNSNHFDSCRLRPEDYPQFAGQPDGDDADEWEDDDFDYEGNRRGVKFKVDAPREDVLHFPNTFRYYDGFWGMSTLQYAFDTLSLIKTESNQALETAAKGGRMKLIIGEEKPPQGAGTLAFGLMNKGEIDKYAAELNEKVYQQDIVGIRGLSALHNISMTSADMQLMEHMNMGLDDVARFFGTPRPMLMLDTNSHYTTYTNATLEYLQRTVQPDVTEMEQEFNRKLLRREDFGRRRIHMCEQPLLRLDKEAQAKVDQLQLQTGAATVNEIRAQYDRPSVPNGDIVYVSTNLAELGSQKLNGNTEPTPEPNQPQP